MKLKRDKRGKTRSVTRSEVVVNVFNQDPEPICMPIPLNGLEYVEDLIYAVLDKLGVGLVCRTLFGVKLSDDRPWLAPNTTIEQLINEMVKKLAFSSSPSPDLYIRMRFRPSCYSRLIRTDKKAFDIIFSQVKYDFLHSKFNDLPRDRLLFNNSVLGLIATDLVRHAIANNLEPQEAIKSANPDKFVPRRVMKWQRSLVFLLGDNLKIISAMKDIYGICKDISKIKQAFIELFLQDVCPDYGSETFQVHRLCQERRYEVVLEEVRLRFQQSSEDSNFLIESSSIDTRGKWSTLCDVNTICYGALQNSDVIINLTNGHQIMLKFANNLIAKSFLSCVSGYYRLMKKWNFSFCRDVASPSLEKLKELRCHGPINYKSMLVKLFNCKPGTFLVRQCLDNSNAFKIDLLLDKDLQLVVVIIWDPSKECYHVKDHLSYQKTPYTIHLEKDEYKSLKSLIDDIQIRIVKRPNLDTSLKHWLVPIESDDCPDLLMSLSKKKLVEMIPKNRYMSKFTDDLPKTILWDHLDYVDDNSTLSSKNGMKVRKAKLNIEQVVIVKEFDCELSPSAYNSSHIMFDTSMMARANQWRLNLKIPLARLADWISVKHSLFAETISIGLGGSPLIQENFPLGSLDKYLAKTSISNIDRQSIVGQLAFAVVYLQEKQMIHGKIRCHNVYISNLNPIKIKITDPLGTIDPVQDKAFLPPSYFGFQGVVSIQEFDRIIDLWALGTTVWQIFNNGKKPPRACFANNLEKPCLCSDETWRVIQSCWIVNSSCQISSQTFYRDLKDSLPWGKLEVPCYHYIDGSVRPSQASETSRADSLSSDSPDLISDTSSQVFQRGNDFFNSRPSLPRRSFRNAFNFFRSNNQIKWREIGHYGSNETSISSMSRSEATQVTNVMETPSIISEYDSEMTSKDLTFGPDIGKGSCGIVRKAGLRECISYKSVAVKCINHNLSNCKEKAKDLAHEFSILRKLEHPNIIQVLGFINESTTMLVLEYMSLGSLLSVLRNTTRDLLLTMPLRKYCLEIARGMEYLEGMNLVHCDLALRNILLNDEDKIKICDFGLAQSVGSEGFCKLNSDRALPFRWYPPEALEQFEGSRIFSHKSDVWSYGIVVWEIYSGGSSPQYSGKYPTLQETLLNERLEKPEDCPVDMYDLMLSCWKYKPDDRCSFKKICQDLGGSFENSVGVEGPTQLVR